MSINLNLKRAIRDEETLELNDIYETGKNIRSLVAENLAFLLMRENLIDKDGDGVIIAPDYILEQENDRFHFAGLYNIYHNGEIIASGSVLGEGEQDVAEYNLWSISANIMNMEGYWRTNRDLRFF